MKTGTKVLKRLRVCVPVLPGQGVCRAVVVPRPSRWLRTSFGLLWSPAGPNGRCWLRWGRTCCSTAATTVMSFKCWNQHCRMWCSAQMNEAFNSNLISTCSLRPLEGEGLLLKYFLILCCPWMELLNDGLCAPWTKKKTFPLFPMQIFHKQNKGTNQKLAFFWNIFDNISVIMRIYFSGNKVCSVVTVWYH